jgi:hypothetical protein
MAIEFIKNGIICNETNDEIISKICAHFGMPDMPESMKKDFISDIEWYRTWWKNSIMP